MFAIVGWVFILASTWLIITNLFQLLALAVGAEGFSGIIAFWIGASILWAVGSAIGAF